MPHDPTFHDVLDAARTGASWAWEHIYDDLAPALLGYLRTRGSQDPEALVGDTFVAVVQGVANFQGDAAGFRSWVFTIATHRLIDEQRKRGRRRTDPTDEDTLARVMPVTPAAEVDALSRVATEDVVDLLAVLTEEQRAVLLLRIVADLTVSEAADVLGRTANATKSLQRRALRRLSRHLAQDPYRLELLGR